VHAGESAIVALQGIGADTAYYVQFVPHIPDTYSIPHHRGLVYARETMIVAL
jgi:hypothetical protein